MYIYGRYHKIKTGFRFFGTSCIYTASVGKHEELDSVRLTRKRRKSCDILLRMAAPYRLISGKKPDRMRYLEWTYSGRLFCTIQVSASNTWE